MCVDVYLCMEQRETRVKSDFFVLFPVNFKLLCLCVRNGYSRSDFFAQLTKGKEQTRVLAEDQKTSRGKKKKVSEHQQRGSKHTDPTLPCPPPIVQVAPHMTQCTKQ